MLGTSHQNRTARRPALVAALAAAATGLCATPALADSIVYIDGGNVWSAQPDGSGAVQLTDGGNWHSPTQADDGTIAAVDGTGPIQVLAPDGRPIRSIQTPPAPTANGGTFAPRPVQLAFSADGSKIAYAYVALSCPPASSCNMQRSTFYTEADVTEATPHTQWGNQFGVADPSWVTGARTLVSGGYGSQVAIDDLDSSEDHSFTAWMVPDTDMGDPEVSRDGKRLAATFSYGADMLVTFFAVNGDVATETPPAQPDLACQTDAGDAEHGGPSWSPDGTSVAYESSRGIEIVTFSRLVKDACEVASERLFSTTGDTPDWGPAEPPAARWQPPADGGGEDGGGGDGGGEGGSGGGQGGDSPTTPGGGEISVFKPKASASRLRKGLPVRVHVTGPATVKAKLTHGGRKLAAGKASPQAAGPATVKLSKVRKGKAAKLRGKKLLLKVTVTPAGGAPVKISRRVRVS